MCLFQSEMSVSILYKLPILLKRIVPIINDRLFVLIHNHYFWLKFFLAWISIDLDFVLVWRFDISKSPEPLLTWAAAALLKRIWSCNDFILGTVKSQRFNHDLFMWCFLHMIIWNIQSDSTSSISCCISLTTWWPWCILKSSLIISRRHIYQIHIELIQMISLHIRPVLKLIVFTCLF